MLSLRQCKAQNSHCRHSSRAFYADSDSATGLSSYVNMLVGASLQLHSRLLPSTWRYQMPLVRVQSFVLPMLCLQRRVCKRSSDRIVHEVTTTLDRYI